MNIAVIDDQVECLQLMKSRLYDIHEYQLDICFFKSIRDFEKSDTMFHLVLLDIDMPDINGLDYAKMHTDQNIVFITNYSSYMKKAYGPNVYAFIEKDDSSQEFHKQRIEVLDRISMQETIHIKIQNGNINIFVKDIIYVQYIDRLTICIKLKNHEYIVKGQSMKSFVEKLGDKFLYADRDIAFNIDMVMGIMEDKLILRDIHHQLSISKRKLQQVKKVYYSKFKC